MKKFALLPLLSLLLAACSSGEITPPHSLGNPDAKVLIEEFSDPECPACANISPQVEQFVKDNPSLARMEYYHFPLSQHKFAFIVAEGAECAGDQGKFWEYLDTIFETQASLSEDHIFKVADSLELDRTTFDACVDDHKYKSKILSHMAEGSRRRIPGTPTLFVNGEMVRWSDPETFKSYLESL
ncbi:MAG: DsbA family protein [Candidatus Peregrinibacteria bacterium]|nr:DsbA family protein [Candidatus Peregrinibacteria bacterium]